MGQEMTTIKKSLLLTISKAMGHFSPCRSKQASTKVIREPGGHMAQAFVVDSVGRNNKKG